MAGAVSKITGAMGMFDFCLITYTVLNIAIFFKFVRYTYYVFLQFYVRLGKGIAALTFDKDYQRKRQEQLNKQPSNLQEGLARSGKGLVMVSEE